MISFNDLVTTDIPIVPIAQGSLYSISGEDGTPIIEFKTLLKAEYKSRGSVVSESIEMNSFAAYNKTTEPREYSFSVALQAPNNDFSSAVSKLEELKKGTELFSFVTPYLVFNSLTLEGYSTAFETYTSMMVVDLECKEILQVEQGYTNVNVQILQVEQGYTNVNVQSEATPISQESAADESNADTVGTGITNTEPATTTETQETEESILSGWGV